ncbi:unnamed protein product (macronuclear) [Paramecium tetraurelia]|uniref:RAP domain-containing protein n=1 Tax=Paramecium tetraurelia TaxID=5888 RepID=A0CUA5_PARTE|nr:uncharacterized protein GSPATT00010572001 [Paramecium tetraurelia]CAK74372.1 unnamed protein product [Paramecium tetraurelia]|eukprot:XP_001441769.1 hypothetical protein (macronuclear) [Paramecium tetraurelia strain d4-2]
MFQYKVVAFFCHIKQAVKSFESEVISTAYLRKKELATLNTMLFTLKDQDNYQEIRKMIKDVLPPVQSISKIIDLKEYSRIAYKLDMKKDSQILEQLLTLILQDQFGNFVLKDKLIKHIIQSIKISMLEPKVKQLLEQLKLKESEVQQKYINIYIDLIQQKVNQGRESSESQMTDQNVVDLNNQELKSEKRIQILNQIIFSKQVKQNQQILFEHFQQPSIEEIMIILPQIHLFPGKLRSNYTEILNKYLNQLMVSPREEGKVLTQLNQMILKNSEFFKKSNISFIHILNQIQMQGLLESQINQLLYLITYSNSLDYFRQNEQQFIDYIIKNKAVNMSQMVAYFFHLAQIYRQIGDFKEELLKFQCTYFMNNLSKCDSNQLFLIIKSLRVCQNIEEVVVLNKQIEQKIQEGALNQNHDALINFVANKIKQSQVLFMPETANMVTVTQKNFGEWCHLIQQIGALKTLETDLIDKFKRLHINFRERLSQNQLYYYFAAQLICGVHDERYFLDRINQTRPFLLVRILYDIAQFPTHHYEKLKQRIIEKIKDTPDYLTQEFSKLDKGLLSFSILAASLFEDQSFYNYLLDKYKREIEQFTDELISNNKKFQRNKIIGKSSVNFVTNQSLVQFYQALRYHHCLANEESGYLIKLQDLIKDYSLTQQEMPSYIESVVESVLKEEKVEFIRDYCEVLPFRIDFYIPSKQIGIECNGVSHYCLDQLRRGDVLKMKYFEEKLNIKISVIRSGCVNIQEMVKSIIK